MLVQQRMRDRFNGQKAMSILRMAKELDFFHVWKTGLTCTDVTKKSRFVVLRFSGGCGELLLRGITLLFSNVIHVLPEERTTRISCVCKKSHLDFYVLRKKKHMQILFDKTHEFSWSQLPERRANGACLSNNKQLSASSSLVCGRFFFMVFKGKISKSTSKKTFQWSKRSELLKKKHYIVRLDQSL